jgi:hypothetical protein
VVLRRAVETDVAAIVDLLADDELGATRENDTSDLAPSLSAFHTIDAARRTCYSPQSTTRRSWQPCS